MVTKANIRSRVHRRTYMDIVPRALDALEAGADEVLADTLTEQVRQGLTAPRPSYLPQA